MDTPTGRDEGFSQSKADSRAPALRAEAFLNRILAGFRGSPRRRGAAPALPEGLPPRQRMALVNVTNINVLDNPAPSLNPFQFEITFECLQQLESGTSASAAAAAPTPRADG